MHHSTVYTTLSEQCAATLQQCQTAVGLAEGEYRENFLCVAVLCTITMVHKGTSSSYRLVDCIGLWSCLVQLCVLQALLCLWCSRWYICINLFCLRPSLYLLVSWAWLDWPSTWLTSHRPLVLWHCWLGHLTCKIIFEMTYNVTSGTLNPTIPYHSLSALTQAHNRYAYHLVTCRYTLFKVRSEILCLDVSHCYCRYGYHAAFL